jgi:succinate dehydrogenase / fumarate reductase cytochrome b subunit
MKKDQRPVFLNLFRIRLPVGAVLSIGHRISGVLMFVLLPAGLYLLQLSLSGPEGFQDARAALQNGWHRVLVGLLLWVFFHHLFAGVRHLALDCHVGVGRQYFRVSAWCALAAAPVMAIVGAWLL